MSRTASSANPSRARAGAACRRIVTRLPSPSIAALVIWHRSADEGGASSALSDRARPESRVELGVGWLALEYAENRGAAFGLFPGWRPSWPWPPSPSSLGLLVYVTRRASPSPAVVDRRRSARSLGAHRESARPGQTRLRRSIYVSVGPWPNFNVADSAITRRCLATGSGVGCDLTARWRSGQRADRAADDGRRTGQIGRMTTIASWCCARSGSDLGDATRSLRRRSAARSEPRHRAEADRLRPRPGRRQQRKPKFR